MTTFDPADAKVSIFNHLVNLDYWTAALPEDASDADLEKAKVDAEDFAGMLIDSLSMNPVGTSDAGDLLVSMMPLDDQALENWIVEYSEGFEVSEILDEEVSETLDEGLAIP